MKNSNANGVDLSLQISRLGTITEGVVFKLDSKMPFLVKNLGANNVVASVKLANMTGFIPTIFYPGWNPELVQEIEVFDNTTLQYGN